MEFNYFEELLSEYDHNKYQDELLGRVTRNMVYIYRDYEKLKELYIDIKNIRDDLQYTFESHINFLTHYYNLYSYHKYIKHLENLIKNINYLNCRIEKFAYNYLFIPLDKNGGKRRYLYIMKIDTSDNYYKIGLSKNVPNRVKDLSTLMPYDIVTVYYNKCLNAFTNEAVIHNILDNKRVKGEWFELDDNDLELVIKMIDYCSLKGGNNKCVK